MVKLLMATRRKPDRKGGANRTLLTIPKGTLGQLLQPFRETAPAARSSAGVMHFPGAGGQPERGPSRVCGCRREDHRQRMEENRRRLEEKQKLRAYLAPLFDALPLGVLIADEQNRFEMANAEACRMLFGQARGGAVGAAQLAGFETELGRVLQSLAESGSRYFHLRDGSAGQLVRVQRIRLAAEPGLAADRVYLLQAVDLAGGGVPAAQNGASA